MTAIFNVLTCFSDTVWVNGRSIECDGAISVINGVVTCHGQEMTRSNSSSSFSSIKGSGKKEIKHLPLKDVQKIAAYTSGNLTIKQCEDPLNCIEQLIISADDNILPLLEQYIKNNTVELRAQGNTGFFTQTPITYEATLKDINSISTSGSMTVITSLITSDNLDLDVSGHGDITMDKIIAKQLNISTSGSSSITAGLQTDTLQVDLSGSADIKLNGKTKKQKVDLSGSGKYDGKNLESESTYCNISGSGSLDISATKEIKGSISGAGLIRYNGKHDPKVDVRKVGSGSVKKSSW